MKSFWEISELIKEDAPLPGGGPMGGMGTPGSGALPGGGPMGGMGAPMGGGMPMGGGGLGGLGGPPMAGGGMGAPPTPATQIKSQSVWEILEKILDGKPVDKPEKKPAGQSISNMLQGGQPSPQPPSPINQQGQAPLGPPPGNMQQAPPM